MHVLKLNVLYLSGWVFSMHELCQRPSTCLLKEGPCWESVTVCYFFTHSCIWAWSSLRVKPMVLGYNLLALFPTSLKNPVLAVRVSIRCLFDTPGKRHTKWLSCKCLGEGVHFYYYYDHWPTLIIGNFHTNIHKAIGPSSFCNPFPSFLP